MIRYASESPKRKAVFSLPTGLAILAGALSLTFVACATQQRARADARPTVYVITGASSGFGRGVALRLAKEQANLVLVARREAVLRDVADQVASLGGVAMVAPADVADPQALESIAAATMARFGRIDVWINDAGVGAIGPFESIPEDEQARVVDINLKSVIFGSAAALRVFRRQGRGTLVNIGSIDSEVPLAYQATYAATKAAVLSLGRSINEEMRLAGLAKIRVSTIMPWAADTPWWKHASNHSGRMPAMVGIDPPDKVVEAIVRATRHPREEILVGWKARSAYWGHRLAPDATERFAADIARRVQMGNGSASAPTAGAIFAPTPEGQGIQGGWRDALRNQEPPDAQGQTAR